MSVGPPASAATPATRPKQGAPKARPPATRTAAPVQQRQPEERRRVSTPRALRWWTFGTALACVIFALTTMVTMWGATTSATQASDDAEQLIRVQTIRANLLRADSLATNAFLAGGLDKADQREAYDTALRETSALITNAAAAQPADRDALAKLNQAVTRYAAAMEQARASNDKDFQAGAAYLTRASDDLRSTALPLLDDLANANQARAAQQLSSLGNVWFEVIGLACLVVLLVAMVWMARRFHRVVNLGLLIATLAVLATWIVGGSLLATARNSADNLRNGDLQTISAVGEARAAGNEAKVQESLRLIAKGSGGSHEKAWQESSRTVTDLTGTLDGDADDLGDLWASYSSAHKRVAALDDQDKWEEAVKQATATSAKSPNATFTAFDERAAEVLTARGEDVRRGTDSRAIAPFLLLVIGVPVLVASGVSAGIGVRRRLREYL